MIYLFLVTRTPEKVPVVQPIDYHPSDNDKKFAIGDIHFLLKTEGKHGQYCALELHVPKTILESDELQNEKYRVFIHTGTTKELLVKNDKKQESSPGTKKIYLLDTIGEAEALYESFLTKYTEKQGYRQFQLISPRIGSALVSSSSFASSNSSISILQPSIQSLVSSVC